MAWVAGLGITDGSTELLLYGSKVSDARAKSWSSWYTGRSGRASECGHTASRRGVFRNLPDLKTHREQLLVPRTS